MDDAIIVTARRREESVQTVPLTVTAFSGQDIANKGVVNTDDLQKFVPGVIFTGAGGPATTTYFIRGQGRDVIGASIPSVIVYMNDVPLQPSSSLAPTYDLANVQVLKGPQGVLFGRNTTGGAVLVNTASPTHEFEGYVEALYGSYDWKDLQGAINIPIVKDVLAVRLAGQLTRRDGYTKEQTGLSKNKDSRHEDQGRVSLLFEPTDTIRNTTVFDYFEHHSAHAGIVPTGEYLTTFLAYNHGFAEIAFGPELGALIADGFDCGSIECDVDMQIARQVAAGKRKSWHNTPDRMFKRVWGVSNTTVVDLGPVTLKSIFGYRVQRWVQDTDSDGTTLPLLDTYVFQHSHQISEELQLSGQLFNSRLDWLIGAFYLKDKADGPYGAKFDLYRPASIPQDAWPLSTVQNTFFSDDSRAVFASLSYSLGGALSGVKLNAAARYTEDKEGACSQTVGPFSTPAIDGWDACRVTLGATTSKAKFSKTTWLLGVDYRVDENIFAYVTARSGYRAGQLNTPQLGGILIPLQAYGPQSVLDFEGGLKTNWNAGGITGRFNIAAFRSKITDYQRQVSSIPPGFDGDGNPLTDPSFTTLTINGGTVVIKGIEVDGYISPVEGLTLNFSGAHLDPKYTKVSAPPILANIAGAAPTFDKAPRWSFAGGVNYVLPLSEELGRISVSADYYWVDKYFAQAVVFPAHDTLDARIDWRNISGSPISASVFVNNLTNSAYQSFSALTGFSPGFVTSVWSPPRMWGGRLRYDF